MRAAHLSGAGKLSIKLNSHSLRCRFDGKPLTEKDCSKLVQALLQPGEEERLHQLALALFQGVFEAGRGELNGQAYQKGTFRCIGNYRVGPTEISWTGHQKKGWLGALQGLLPGNEIFQAVYLKELLTEHCCFGSLQIMLNSQLLRAKPPVTSLGSPTYFFGQMPRRAQRGFEVCLPDCPDSIEAGLTTAARIGQILLVVDGVATPVHHLREFPGLTARLHSDRLHLDLSQTLVVQDDAYRSMLDCLTQFWLKALGALAVSPDSSHQYLRNQLLLLVPGSEDFAVLARQALGFPAVPLPTLYQSRLICRAASAYGRNRLPVPSSCSTDCARAVIHSA